MASDRPAMHHNAATRGVAVAGLLALAACAGTSPTATPAEPPAATGLTTTLSTRAPFRPEVPSRIEVVLPPIPAIAVPDLSALTATGGVVAERLGARVSSTSGVEVVTATCGAGDGDLLYHGSTGTDLFAIEKDGSGVYVDRGDAGLVTLRVDESGGGEFYHDGADGLTTILVRADGSGEYFRQEPAGTVSITTAGDGSGEYYDDRHGAVTTIARSADGSGRYYRRTAEELLTIDAAADGTAEYYREPATGPVVTLRIDADGGWVLTTASSEQLVEVTVTDDGSGRYRRTGLTTVDIVFGIDGRSPDGAVEVVVPETPRFDVSGAFPSLGRLGSLQPPCATVVRFDAQLLFAFGASTLRTDDPATAATLDEVVPVLNDTGRPIRIVGHTDAVGDEAANDELSLARAEAVATALAARGLVVPLEVAGMGERQPVSPNQTPDGADDPAGRARNRRVEIVIPEPDTVP
ncbi:MAG: OmpA family protein [Actinomycetota bacterium]